VKRVVLGSVLIISGVLNPASANSHHRHPANHRRVLSPATYRSLFGLRVYEAPHRRTHSWSTGDADAALRQSTDDALRRQQDDNNTIQQMNNGQ
jgi:hypothetical protein